MYKAACAIPVTRLLTGIFLWVVMTLAVQADNQVQFSTQTKLLKIPSAVIDNQQQVYDIEMILQPNSQFALTQVNDQPLLQTGLNEKFDLLMDQSIWLKDSNVQLKLVAVTGDSRCSVGAACVVAGEVSLVFSIFQATTRTHDFLLTLGAGSDLVRIEIGGFRISLIQVSPPPAPGSAATPANYIATMIINAL